MNLCAVIHYTGCVNPHKKYQHWRFTTSWHCLLQKEVRRYQLDIRTVIRNFKLKYTIAFFVGKLI